MRRSAVLALVCGLLAAPARPAVSGLDEKLDDYRGLGAWVDIFDPRQIRKPVRAVEEMASLGVRTLFLETSNYRQEKGIVYPKATGRFIHAAHEHGMSVVAWYLPGFQKPKQDRKRSLEAIGFRTSEGDGFDSFALDIEDSTIEPASRRTKRLLRLSTQIRTAVGASYPLGAIIPAPRGMQLKRDYWPGFPFAELAEIYDVFLPMGYWSYRTEGGLEYSRDYARRNVSIIRRRTGDAAVPIHAIGGVSDDVTRAEVRGFVRGAREHGVLGASLYDFDTTTGAQWNEMAGVPVNPHQPVPLPVKLGHAEPLGNLAEDTSHPKEVVFAFGGREGDRRLDFQAFDVAAGEVEILVNWQPLADVAVTPPGVWGPAQSVTLPDALLLDAGRNVVSFVAAGDHPDWSEWGVRKVSLAQA